MPRDAMQLSCNCLLQLDVLIVGGYYGKGVCAHVVSVARLLLGTSLRQFFLQHRAGMISHFLCGVALSPDNPRDNPSVFYTFCKVHMCSWQPACLPQLRGCASGVLASGLDVVGAALSPARLAVATRWLS